MDAPIAEVLNALKRHKHFLVASHYNPDGDAIGSTAAMGFILKALGKSFRLYNVSGLPRPYDWVKFPAPLRDSLPKTKPDCVITLDCGDLSRAGGRIDEMHAHAHSINIDHHLGNPMFGDINWVDPSYSSVGEMLAEVAEALEQPLSGGLGEAVYLALVTDTGYFSYDNTSPRTMEIAADIIRQGLRPGPFNARVQNQWSRERIALMSRILDGVELRHDGKLGLIRITRRMMTETGAAKHDTEGIINYIRRIRSVKIAAALREEVNGSVKFSLRSTGDVNVQEVAASFGGGGHKNASGGQIEAPIDRAADILTEACGRILGTA